MKIDDLANAFVDDQLDAEGLHELSQILDQDPEARRAFVRIVDQHQALASLLGRARVARRTRVPWIAAAAAAALLIAAATFFLTRPREVEERPAPPVVREKKSTAPPPVPAPKDPEVAPPVVPEKKPLPDPKSAPSPAPREPEKPALPEPPREKPVEPELQKPEPAPAPAPPPARTLAVLATIESAEGKVFRGKLPLNGGDALFEGDTIEASAGRAAMTFADGARMDLVGQMTIMMARRTSLTAGTLTAEIAKQPAGSPFVITTPHAEAQILGTKLRISAAAETRLEVKEGRVKLTRLDDKRAIEVSSGHFAVAAKGVELSARKITRGSMMAGAVLWGEDFSDPRAVEKDWRVSRNGLGATYNGPLEFDLHPSGDAGDSSLFTETTFAAPVRVTVDVEFSSRLRGALAALRLQSWKEGKDIVHVDLDEDRYYLTVGDKVVTADAGRKNPRRERWSVELRSDGSVVFTVDGKELLRGKRDAAPQEFHITLLAKGRRETPAGAKLRFENLLVERAK